MAQPASASGAAGSTASVECSLYGLVGDGALAVLLDRLVALCGDVRRGVLGSPDFEEHEAVFVPAAPAQREEGARLEDTMLRLRSSVIDSRTHERVLDFNAREWRMSSYGNPDPRNPACVVRAVASAAVKGRVFELVAALGFKYMFDFTRRGYAFTWDYVIRVTVTQTYRVLKPMNVDATTVLDPRYWVIEAVAPHVPLAEVPQMERRLQTLAGFLSGLVDLRVPDPKSIQHRVPPR